MAEAITGQLLRVRLSSREVCAERLPAVFSHTYFGGEGFVAYFLLTEVPRGADPLGPENKIIFANGPLTGGPVAGGGRNAIGAKSPLTGALGTSEVGGYWGAELKKVGWDALVVEGRADRPVYLYIKDGQVEIRDASHLKGLPTARAHELLKGECADEGVRVCQIGPAGENLVPFACVTCDLTHFAGRTGVGAVMGSKNLRAIVVRGTGAVKPHDENTVWRLARWMGEQGLKKTAALSRLGTASVFLPYHLLGGLPTRNFREGQFEAAEKLSGERLRDTYLVGQDTCSGCPVRCKRVVSIRGPYQVDPVYGGPEYESITALGPCCGVDSLEAVCKANELCNAYGLDTISTGVTIAFAMECFENGMLTPQDTGGVKLTFGNHEAMLALIEQIAHRRGLGNLLADGVRKAAEKLGKGAQRYAMHVKGLELPMHEPRLKPGMGVGYAVSPTGADHCHNVHDTYYVNSVDGVEPFGILEPLPAAELSENKVRLLRQQSTWRHLQNCLVQCEFMPWSSGHVVEAVRALTGWDTSLLDLFYVGERAQQLARVFNLREGIGKEQDNLPERLLEPFPTGPIAGVAASASQIRAALQDYYGMMGWDEKGVPTEGKLKELGISWASSYLV